VVDSAQKNEIFRFVETFGRKRWIVPGALCLARHKVAFVADDRFIVHTIRINHEHVPTQGAPVARSSPQDLSRFFGNRHVFSSMSNVRFEPRAPAT